MTTITVPVLTGHEDIVPRQVQAEETPAPGLFIHPVIGCGGGFSITHGASGYKLGEWFGSNRRQVLAVVAELAPLADWTLPARALRAVPGLTEQARGIVTEWGGEIAGRLGPDEPAAA